ncbi:MAG: hypothetical protein ACI9CF_000556 [Candidatus Omnitrophota bacterium]|jgi:hypothetical protein
MSFKTTAMLIIVIAVLGTQALNVYAEAKQTDLAAIKQQIQALTKNQDLILQKLDEIKEQIRIVKVRVT